MENFDLVLGTGGDKCTRTPISLTSLEKVPRVSPFLMMAARDGHLIVREIIKLTERLEAGV